MRGELAKVPRHCPLRVLDQCLRPMHPILQYLNSQRLIFKPVSAAYAEQEGGDDDSRSDHAPSNGAGIVETHPSNSQEEGEEAVWNGLSVSSEGWNDDSRPKEERCRYSVGNSKPLQTSRRRGAEYNASNSGLFTHRTWAMIGINVDTEHSPKETRRRTSSLANVLEFGRYCHARTVQATMLPILSTVDM